MFKSNWNVDEIYSTINRVNEALASARQQHHITSGFLDAVSEVFGSNFIWIQLFDFEDRSLRLASSRGLTDGMKEELEFEHRDSNLAYQTAALCHNINVPDLPASEFSNLPSFLKQGVRSIVSVPILTYRSEGLVGIASVTREAFSDEAVKLFATLAGLLGTSLIHARLFELQLARERQLAYQAQLEMTLTPECERLVEARSGGNGKSFRKFTGKNENSPELQRECILPAGYEGEAKRGDIRLADEYDVDEVTGDKTGMDDRRKIEHMLKMKNFSLSHSHANG